MQSKAVILNCKKALADLYVRQAPQRDPSEKDKALYTYTNYTLACKAVMMQIGQKDVR